MNYPMGFYQPQQMQMPMFQQMPIQAPTQFVADFEQIKASDVPMDGKWVLFGKNDMSEVCAKAWTPQGQIQSLVYKLAQEPSISTTTVPKAENGAIFDEFKALKEDMATIISKIDNLNSNRGGKRNESNANAQ